MKVDIQRAVELLKSGEVVAIPTETVYGLAAVISNPQGIGKIFSTKKRPFFDPLIVHVSSLKQAQEICSSWGEVAQALAEAFWPGPLTLVLPKSDKVSDLITSGLPTVGVRWPRHPQCLELLKDLGIPVAAPSANLFGKTSPSRAEHVESEFQGLVPVLDGGASEVGIESTIVRVDGNSLQILRSGVITLSQVKDALERKKVNYQIDSVIHQRQAPGMMKHHYMPQVPLVLVHPGKKFDAVEALEMIRQAPAQIDGVTLVKPKSLCTPKELVLPEDSGLAARRLYTELRKVADQGADVILFYVKPSHLGEDWLGIMDRLTKAASIEFR